MQPKNIRRIILETAHRSNSAHIACSFSIVEILTVIFNNFISANDILNRSEERNYVCLSKGHGVLALYSCLNQINIIQDFELLNYLNDGSLLTGLSDAHVPGVEVSGGSLGQGVTVATGIALSKKLSNFQSKIFCIVGDGEINEGSAWEAFLIAAHQKLSNLIIIVDANSFQAMGKCHSVLNMEPFKDKFNAFNFETLECDGHNVAELKKCFDILTSSSDPRPKVLIARTVKGKGVSFMEDDNIWHYTRLNSESFDKAMKELS